MYQFTPFGMGEPIDLDINAIIKVMDLYEIVDKKKCFEKIRFIWIKYRQYINEFKEYQQHETPPTIGEN
jgi:hypothetical protein